MAIHKLSAARIAKLTKNGMYGDGGNLWLAVTNNGVGKSWVFRWTERATGRERVMGLGPLHTIDLARARALARANREMLLEGKDPKAERDGRRLDDQIARGLVRTVSQVADEYYEAKYSRSALHTRKNAAHVLKHFVHDPIGHMPIQKVTRDIVLNKTGLAEAWRERHRTAKHARGYLNRLFKFAIAYGYYSGENPASWDHMQHVLPHSADVHEEKHHPSLPYKDIYPFLQKVRAYKGTRGAKEAEYGKRPHSSLWLELVVLTGLRVNEVSQARWKEFDLERMVWTVAHVKKIRNRPRKPFAIPITPPMLVVLEELQARRTDPSPDAPILPKDDGTTRHYSTLATWIRDTLRWEPHVDAHGFRSTLRDWCRANKFQDELWNFQVNHAQGNAVSQAYGHDTMIEQRRDMMKKWGEYCSTPPVEPQSNNVTHLAERRR